MGGESRWDDLSQISNSEHCYRVVKFLSKSVAGALPSGLSALAAELFDILVSDPAVQRRDRFLMDLTLRIDALETEGKLSLEKLENNEEVAALLIRTTQAAMRSSGEQKFCAIREAALKGLLSAATKNTSPAQVVVGILDRMTEYHVILLFWENSPRTSYTLGQLQSAQGEEARRSRFYGQPVFTDRTKLKAPVSVFSYMNWGLYVEQDEHTAFKLAHADLAAMGLLKPILKMEEYVVDRVVKRRTTPEIAGYEISDLGKFVCNFISSDSLFPSLAQPNTAET